MFNLGIADASGAQLYRNGYMLTNTGTIFDGFTPFWEVRHFEGDVKFAGGAFIDKSWGKHFLRVLGKHNGDNGYGFALYMYNLPSEPLPMSFTFLYDTEWTGNVGLFVPFNVKGFMIAPWVSINVWDNDGIIMDKLNFELDLIYKFSLSPKKNKKRP
jgi:hypothetical protein